MKAGIAGAACRVERQFSSGIEPLVREAVCTALDKAAISLADIDMVVTVASDTLDGMMVPIRAELAGALGKNYLNVPSSAGHALAAAAAAIEAGDAATALVVGWGAASKLAVEDGRSNQLDPFYLRPLGASPKVLGALQKQTLIAGGLTSEDDLEAFRTRMAGIVWNSENPACGFCDGVAAIVLRRFSDQEVGVIVADYAMASRSHTPLDGSLDPSEWVNEAISGFSAAQPKDTAPRGFIEVSGSNICAEMRGIVASVEAGLVDCAAAAANDTGGGASAWFGPATGLRTLVKLYEDRLADGASGGADSGLFVDLAGPLGQHVTCVLIERRSMA